MAAQTTFQDHTLALNAIVKRWDRRLRLRQTVRWLPISLIPGLVIGLLLAVLARMRPLLMPTQIALITAGLVVLGALVGALAIWLWRRSTLASAQRFDVLFRLNERISTALEIGAGSIHTLDELALRQLEDARERASAVRARDYLPLALRRQDWLMVISLVVALALLLLLPNPQVEALNQASAQQTAVASAADDLRDLTQDVAADTALGSEERQTLLEELKTATDTLEQPNITPEEALAAISGVQSDLQNRANDLNQQATSNQAALQQAANALRQASQNSPAQDGQQGGDQAADAPPADQTASDSSGDQSTENQPPQQAMDQVAQSLDQMAQNSPTMTDAERQQAAQQLQQAAQQLQQTNPQAAQMLQQAAQQMQQGQQAQMQQSLEQARQQMQQQASQAQQQMQAAQSMSNAAQQAQQAQQQMQQSQQNSGDQSQQGQQGQSQQNNGSQPQGDQGQQGQSGEQGQAGNQGQPQQGQAGQQGQSQQGQSAPGDSQGNQGQQTTDQQGGSQQSGGAGDSAGGQGDDQPGGQSGTNDGAQQDNHPDGQGERQFESVYAPRRLAPQANDGNNIQLDPDASDAPVQEGDFSDNPNGQATVPYDQVYGDYADAANRALDSDYVPLGLRDVVRDYFTSLEPRP